MANRQPNFLGRVPPEKQCRAKSRRTGEQCRNPAIGGALGGTHCRMHGASALQTRMKYARLKVESKVIRDIEKSVAFADVDIDALLRAPLDMLAGEIAKSTARLRYLDGRIAELDDVVWQGPTRKELLAAGVRNQDATTIQKANIGRLHPVVDLRERESQHLARLTGVLINNGGLTSPSRSRQLAAARKAATREALDSVEMIIAAVLRGLKINPADPDVRRVVRDALLDAAAAAPTTEQEVR